ncbi:MAG: hypothetical protein ABSD96_06705 [Candidatus Korobacteraceae bacterium]
MRPRSYALIGLATLALAGIPALAQNQTIPGQGNANAVALSGRSPMVQSAMQFLVSQAETIHDQTLRKETLDVLTNVGMCLQHRVGLTDAKKNAFVQQMIALGLADKKDDATFPGGLKAGIFPPVIDENSPCPKPPQPYSAAPGSSFGGHHSYPGGLAVHASNNESADVRLANEYRQIYGRTGANQLPVIDRDWLKQATNASESAIFIDQDIIVAAPLWHDWAKTLVFQWNADGSEFQELNFAGNGATDAYGAAGDSKVAAHHIIGVAEAMKRGLSPAFVITQASAHSAPTNGNEYKVVNWLRAAALLAQIDPVEEGYLTIDKNGRLRLPPVRKLGAVDLMAASPSQTNLLVEYTLHGLSDADFTYSIPAVTSVQIVLQALAPQFGYDSSRTSEYNNRYRNPVLSFMTAERLLIIYSERGSDGVLMELNKLRKAGII